MHLSLLDVYVVPDDNISSWIYLAVTSNSGYLIKICQIKLFTIIFSLMWIPSRNMFIIVCICFIFSEFVAFLCTFFFNSILLYNSILYCFISNGSIVYALFWVICGRIVTIISFPGAMFFKIDTNQSIFQCHKWITEIIIYYIKLQYLFSCTFCSF